MNSGKMGTMEEEKGEREGEREEVIRKLDSPVFSFSLLILSCHSISPLLFFYTSAL